MRNVSLYMPNFALFSFISQNCDVKVDEIVTEWGRKGFIWVSKEEDFLKSGPILGRRSPHSVTLYQPHFTCLIYLLPPSTFPFFIAPEIPSYSYFLPFLSTGWSSSSLYSWLVGHKENTSGSFQRIYSFLYNKIRCLQTSSESPAISCYTYILVHHTTAHKTTSMYVSTTGLSKVLNILLLIV